MYAKNTQNRRTRKRFGLKLKKFQEAKALLMAFSFQKNQLSVAIRTRKTSRRERLGPRGWQWDEDEMKKATKLRPTYLLFAFSPTSTISNSTIWRESR